MPITNQQKSVTQKLGANNGKNKTSEHPHAAKTSAMVAA
jgi:hypothetical protein